MQLIEFTDRGLYCRVGDFYIDPWKPVEKAVITHAHSDHARPDNQNYLCHPDSLPVLNWRLGKINSETLDWNQSINLNGVKISLHPAGHIIGSSQVRVEYKGEVWVASGDYKTEDDGISSAFEPIACHSFITESTFGLPIYRWKPQKEIYSRIIQWILDNREAGKNSVLIAYSLGKAQRLIECVSEIADTIWAHGAVWNIQQALIGAGYKLTPVERVQPDTPRDAFKNAVIIAPPSADGTPWMKRFQPYNVGVCSGWMQVRGNLRRRNADAGFALSDHADWEGLIQTVKNTGAEKVYVTHGFQSVFSRWLQDNGIMAAEVKTEYGGEEEEQEKPSTSPEQEKEINEG